MGGPERMAPASELMGAGVSRLLLKWFGGAGDLFLPRGMEYIVGAKFCEGLQAK